MFNILFFISSILFVFTDFVRAQEMRDLVPDTQICSATECYTITRKLGEGAYGKVYAAENSLAEHFAIKEFKCIEFFDSNAELEKEYRIGKILNHPNIVKTVEIFDGYASDNDQKKYLVVELIQGKDLLDVVMGKERLNPEIVLKASLQLVDALRYAYSQQFIFLDCNLSNIMLTDAFDIMLVDLGSFVSFEELQANTELEGEKKSQKLEPNRFTSDFLTHFDFIAEICVKLMLQSNLHREEKIRLCFAIKALSWNCLEDFKDDERASINHCFDELIHVLKSMNLNPAKFSH